ncbi:MAG: tetratricopeptide repeat protein, partial [Candidatus Krumholzibacteria bacterium]|nr:tetratricopeptide repeat protein [Candidatus Krumholzibacteria bacterium]
IVIPAAALVIIGAILTWAISRGPEKGDRAAAQQRNSLGLQYQNDGNVPDAQLEYRNAIISDSQWEIPWNNLAIIELNEGNFDEADSLLGEALKRDPGYTEALYNMGTVKWEKDDLEGAEINLRAAIDADPAFMPAYNNLGSLLINMNRPKEASEVLDNALARFDSTPYPDELKAYLFKNRGIAAADMGDASAETWWRRSLEIIPDNDEVRRLLESVGAL